MSVSPRSSVSLAGLPGWSSFRETGSRVQPTALPVETTETTSARWQGRAAAGLGLCGALVAALLVALFLRSQPRGVDGRNSLQRRPGTVTQPEPAVDEGMLLVHVGTIDPQELADLKIQQPQVALNEPADLHFDSVSLIDALREIARRYRVPILIDEPALTDEGIDVNMPITTSISDVTLKEGLQTLLDPLGITFVVEDGDIAALKITSMVAASDDPLKRNFPDLFKPLQPAPIGPGVYFVHTRSSRAASL